MGWGKPTYNKYKAKKIVRNGVKFDSKLEMFCYNILTSTEIPFDFQVKIELVPKFRDMDGAAVRACFMLVDFVVPINEIRLYVDTKGYATPTSKLKYKLLKHKIYLEEENSKVVFLKNQKEVREFVYKVTSNGYRRNTG